MSLFLTVTALVLACNAVVVAVVALRAPQGYEDGTGFHLGRSPDDLASESELGTIEEGHFGQQEAA